MSTSEQPKTIDEFVDAFEKVYGNLDRKRSIEQIWLQIVEEAANVSEAVREVNYVNVFSHLANTLCWICGLVAKCRGEPNSIIYFSEDFSSIIWRKYPNICPLCQTYPCKCLISKKEIDRRTAREKNQIYEHVTRRAQRTVNDRIRNLDRLVNMFEDIFGPNYFIIPLEEITFHFTEEVGEVAEQIRELYAIDVAPIEEGIRRCQKERIINEFLKELADVFSWMCGILIKINYMIENVNSILIEYGRSEGIYPKITFSETLQKYYMDDGIIVCRTCKQSPCDIKKHKTLYQFRD